MLDRFKSFWQGVMLAPFVNLFIKLGVSPDAVTLVGTIGVSAGALVFFPQGELLIGVLVITAFVFTDLIGLFDLPILIYVALWALAVANTQTVVVRVLKVRRQALAEAAGKSPEEQIPGA